MIQTNIPIRTLTNIDINFTCEKKLYINYNWFILLYKFTHASLTHYCLTGTYLPAVPKFDFNLRRDNQKNSYERRDYKSVDEISLL